MRRHHSKRRSAFTLMELLLVAGILALLAAFAIPKFFSTAETIKIDLAKTAVGANGPMAKALEQYRYDVGKYPESDEGLAMLFKKKGQHPSENYKGPYLEDSYDKACKDPWGNFYEYKSPGDVNEDKYDLWSRGKDGDDDNGKEGSDDIKNWSDK